MSESLEKTVEVNVSGRVMLLCATHRITDLDQMRSAIETVKRDILAQMERKRLGVEALSDLLDKRIARLEKELVGEAAESSAKKKRQTKPKEESEKPAAKERGPVGTAPEKESTFDMTVKLAAERKPLQKLLVEDCVQIGLVTKERAEYLVTQFAGKEPKDAEIEVVIELRNNLHEQIRNFIRKHEGGPWASPKQQEELRLDIVHTPSIGSLLSLTRKILRERQDWMNRNSITGRIFGDRLKVSKET